MENPYQDARFTLTFMHLLEEVKSASLTCQWPEGVYGLDQFQVSRCLMKTLRVQLAGTHWKRIPGP